MRQLHYDSYQYKNYVEELYVKINVTNLLSNDSDFQECLWEALLSRSGWYSHRALSRRVLEMWSCWRNHYACSTVKPFFPRQSRKYVTSVPIVEVDDEHITQLCYTADNIECKRLTVWRSHTALLILKSLTNHFIPRFMLVKSL